VGTISIGDKLIHVYRFVLNKVCRRIFVSEDSAVPPKHGVNVPVKMQDGGNLYPPSDWAINPQTT